MPNISAMILAGGRGKRMETLCYSRPKPLLPFAGRSNAQLRRRAAGPGAIEDRRGVRGRNCPVRVRRANRDNQPRRTHQLDPALGRTGVRSRPGFHGRLLRQKARFRSDVSTHIGPGSGSLGQSRRFSRLRWVPVPPERLLRPRRGFGQRSHRGLYVDRNSRAHSQRR